MKMMRDILKMEMEEFNEKIIDWAMEFNFCIDGEMLVINKDNVGSFIDELDKQFDEWGKLESAGIGKI